MKSYYNPFKYIYNIFYLCTLWSVGSLKGSGLPSQGQVIVAEFLAQMLLWRREKNKITGKTIMALVLITCWHANTCLLCCSRSASHSILLGQLECYHVPMSWAPQGQGQCRKCSKLQRQAHVWGSLLENFKQADWLALNIQRILAFNFQHTINNNMTHSSPNL